MANWTEIVSAWSNVVVACAAVAASYQGIISLNAWRSQMIGKRKAKLAEEIIADFYEARDIIKWVRTQATFSGDVDKRKGRDEESPSERAYKDKYYVPLKRLADNTKFFSRVRARRYRIIALFGREAAKAYDELNEIYTKISATASTFLNISGHNYQDTEMEKILFSIDENDQIALEITELLDRVESYYRKFITGEDIDSRLRGNDKIERL